MTRGDEFTIYQRGLWIISVLEVSHVEGFSEDTTMLNVGDCIVRVLIVMEPKHAYLGLDDALF